MAAIASRPIKRIAFLSILFAALIEFAIERARFDLWIMVAAIVPTLWNIAGRTLRSRVDSQKHDQNASSKSGPKRETGNKAHPVITIQS
jgi:hypothetical protein